MAWPQPLNLICLACLLPLLLAVSPTRAQESQPVPHGQITVGITQFPDTLSPYQGGLLIDQQLQAGMFSPFLYTNGHGRLMPDLLADIPTVQNHQVLDGGRTVILHLKPDRYWSSGAEITSADIVFGWKMDRDKLTGPACLANGCIVRSLRAIDRFTVEARLAHLPPDDVLSWLPDLVPYGWKRLGHNPHDASNLLYQDARFNYEVPRYWTNGPFQARKVVNNDRVVLQRAPHAAGTNEPHVARLLYRFYDSPTALIGALTSGAVDIGTTFTASDLPALRQAASDHYRVVVQPSYLLEHVELNVGSAQFRGKPNPLTDVRVRQALALATDREGLMRDVLHFDPQQMRQLVAYSPWLISPNLTETGADRTITGAWDPVAGRYVAYSPQALQDARTLLAQAGYPQELDLEMVIASRPLGRYQEAQFIASSWGQIGVRLTLQPLRGCGTWAGCPPWVIGDSQTTLFTIPTGPSPYFLNSSFLSSNASSYGQFLPHLPGGNFAATNDRQIQRDWKGAATAPSASRRDAWYRRIQERVVKQAYWIPLYWRPAINAVSPRITGFGRSGMAPVWRPQQWRLMP